MKLKVSLFLFFAIAIASGAALAASPADLLDALAKEARAADPAFRGFSAQRGEHFYRTPQVSDWSCSSCHTDQPAAEGRHAVTHKRIQALAPAANPERFTNPEKVEKWFRRNCNDVLKRSCTVAEKGDFLTYLMAVPASGGGK